MRRPITRALDHLRKAAKLLKAIDAASGTTDKRATAKRLATRRRKHTLK